MQDAEEEKINNIVEERGETASAFKTPQDRKSSSKISVHEEVSMAEVNGNNGIVSNSQSSSDDENIMVNTFYTLKNNEVIRHNYLDNS